VPSAVHQLLVHTALSSIASIFQNVGKFDEKDIELVQLLVAIVQEQVQPAPHPCSLAALAQVHRIARHLV
jgi:hypothetical protein